MTYVTDPRLTCGVTSGRVFLLWFSITFGAIILSCYSRFSSAMSSSSTVGIVGSLLADLLRTFGYSSTSFFSLLGFLLKSYFPFWRLVNAFLWVCILFLRRRALSFFLVFEALVWRFCFSSGTCSTFFLEVEFPYHERVALLGVPFGEGVLLDCEGLLLDCGSPSCSFSVLHRFPLRLWSQG